MIWFGWVLLRINHCWLFNAKSSLYLYIRYIWFGLVGFYGVSTFVVYSMPNPLYTYILNIYDLVWFGLVLWHINHCRLFNVKFSLYMYIRYTWFVNILSITFLIEPKLILLHKAKCFQRWLHISNNSIKDQSFVYIQLNDQTVLFQTIQFSITQKS